MKCWPWTTHSYAAFVLLDFASCTRWVRGYSTSLCAGPSVIRCHQNISITAIPQKPTATSELTARNMKKSKKGSVPIKLYQPLCDEMGLTWGHQGRRYRHQWPISSRRMPNCCRHKTGRLYLSELWSFWLMLPQPLFLAFGRCSSGTAHKMLQSPP